MKRFNILLLLAVLLGCTSAPKLDSFQAQSCVLVYCESSENSKVKSAGLKLTEIALATQGVDLELNRGFCEEYYTKRALDYRYAKKSAYQVCHEDGD